jgi:uncharacterized protein (DUF58 family)
MWFRAIFNRSSKLKARQKNRTAAGAPGDELAELHLSAQAIRQLDRLRLNAGRYLPGHGVGLRPSLRRKPSAEFQQHRMYVPGDDVRFVDWKASARSEHIFVKQGEQPRQATVYLLLDCSASMGWGRASHPELGGRASHPELGGRASHPELGGRAHLPWRAVPGSHPEPGGDLPKSQAALHLAAALAYLALSHGDRLVLAPFSQNILQPLGPISGKGQLPAVVNILRGLKFAGKTDLLQAMRELKRRYTLGGGLTLIISDLLGAQDLAGALAYTPAPTWETVVLHLLHADEFRPSLRGDFEMVDVETGQLADYDINAAALQGYQARLQAWLQSLEMTCSQGSAFYTQIPADWALDSQVIPHLRDVHVVRPL